MTHDTGDRAGVAVGVDTAPLIAGQADHRIAITIYTSESAPLGKRIYRDKNAQVKKVPCAQLYAGTVTTRYVRDLTELSQVRSECTAHQALGYGISMFPEARVVASGMLEQARRDTGAALPVIARDRRHVSWDSGAGILFLDHDGLPSGDVWTAYMLQEALHAAVPALRSVQSLWAPSAGSHIVDEDTLDDVIPLRGSHVYFGVDLAECIPACGQIIFDRLALAGHAWIQVSSSGRMLRRGLIDASVFQPERLDFIRSTCGPGLVQLDPKALLLNERGRPIASANEILASRLNDREAAQLQALWRALEQKASPQAQARRRVWAQARATAALQAPPDSESVQALAARISAAADSGQLDTDDQLRLEDGSVVTVGDVLALPTKYVGTRLADPFEPEYGGGDRRIAKIWAGADGSIGITSFAHGGYRVLLQGGPTAEDDFRDVDDADEFGGAPGDRQGNGPTDGTTVAAARAPLASSLSGSAARSVALQDGQFTPLAEDISGAKAITKGKSAGSHLPTLTASVRRPDLCGFDLAYDSFEGRIMVAEGVIGDSTTRCMTDTDFTRIRKNLQQRAGFATIKVGDCRDVVELVAEEQMYDSAKQSLESLHWDGVPRIHLACVRYFDAEDTPQNRAIGSYIFTAMAGRILQPGVKADMVPVAVGGQGTRKSSTVAAMVPSPSQVTAIDLSRREDDILRRFKGKILVELAELSGLRTRDAEFIKQLISTQVDEWVEKYKTMPRQAPRRFIFFGTSNRDDFLVDPTGNRRWLPFRTGNCDPVAMAADREQLFAEGAEQFRRSGVAHLLAEQLTRPMLEDFVAGDEWVPVIETWLDEGPGFEGEGLAFKDAPIRRDEVTVREVLTGALRKDLTSPNTRRADEMRCADVLSRLGWRKARRHTAGRRENVWRRPAVEPDPPTATPRHTIS